MKRLFIITLIGLMTSLNAFALTPITGTMGTCIGSVSYLSDSLSPGGTWSSSNTAIASVSISIGNVYGISAGVATITYTEGGSYVTASFTVSPIPAAITGTGAVCTGSSITLTDATSGGTWSSFYGTIATVGSTTGVVTGVSGTAYDPIYYYINAGCYTSKTVTVNATSAGYIFGPSGFFGTSYVCIGSAITISPTTAGGTWSSSDPGIATIGLSSGIVTGVSAGTVNITYSVTGICGSASVWDTVTVNSTISAGAISGASSVLVGATVALTDATTTGTWSSSNTAIAIVDSLTGVVTGVSAGSATITYTVSGCSGASYATAAISVTAFDGISGYVNFTGGIYHGPVTVWLITYDGTTHILSAVDSSIVYCTGSSVYYQFTGLASDSFRVKAAVDSIFGSAGFVPTYHTSSYYWLYADVILHTSGTADLNKNINMALGTATSGPGFIAGNVMTGANKSTSGTTSPVAGLLVYAINSASGALMQLTHTDATGSYSFGGLPYGTYFVHPELINFTTVDYTSITLSTAGPIKTGASFIQHTVSHTITPGNVGVANVQSQAASVVAYPNPASGKLNIVWTETTNETGNVSITDVTGREVYKTAIKMNTGSGMGQVDLSALTNGLYIITVKSANIDYNNKIQVQH